MTKCQLTFAFLLSTLMFSTPSYADWEKVGESKIVDAILDSIIYIDADRIRRHDDLVYFWKLVDHPKQVGGRHWKSSLNYIEGDCKMFSLRILRGTLFGVQMSKDIKGSFEFTPSNETLYPLPNSLDERILKRACDD